MSALLSPTVRSAVEGDREPLRRFFAELSPQTSFLRFVAGRTNREVATELFLTVSTVEAALSKIYRKLGVRSRTELATKSLTAARI